MEEAASKSLLIAKEDGVHSTAFTAPTVELAHLSFELASSMMAVLTMAVLSRSFLTAGRRILPGVVGAPGVVARSGVRLCAPIPPTVSVNPLLDASLPARVLAFYVIAPVAEPEAAVDRHRDFLTAREMSGRVYLSADGMNAQVSGLAAACAEYRDFVAAEFPSERLLFKEDPVDELAFPRLRVKHKALVPEMADGAAVDLADRGEDVAPEEWQRMLAERNTSNVRVLDVRNGYEWDVGRFDGAERPEGDTFAEQFPWSEKRHSNIKEMLGETFLKGDGTEVSINELDGKYIGVLLSATWHWQCRLLFSFAVCALGAACARACVRASGTHPQVRAHSC